MAAGLISGDVTVVHHGLHQRVILGDAGDPCLRDVIGPAVAHVGDHRAVLIGHSGNQSGTHIGKRRLRRRPLRHGPVGHGHRVGRSLPELLRGHIRFQGLLHLRRVSLRRQRTGKPAAGGAAHTVAHHGKGRAIRHFAHKIGVLVGLTDPPPVGFSNHVQSDHLVSSICEAARKRH